LDKKIPHIGALQNVIKIEQVATTAIVQLLELLAV
jgi:hypothetical protein